MQINSQNSCNSSYNIRQRHYLYAERERKLPNLFQDDLLCAAHDVRIVTYNEIIWNPQIQSY